MAMAADPTMRAERIARLIEEKLGVGGVGLEAKLRRAGRDLPRWVRREAAALAEAAAFSASPRLAKRIDPARIERAFAACEAWLSAVDPAERRKDRWLGFLAVNAVNLTVLAAALVAVLIWTGHL